MPQRLDDGHAPHQPDSAEDMYRAKYFEAVDVLCGELNRRFDQRDIRIAGGIEKIFLDSANGCDTDIPDKIAEPYKGDLDIDRLRLHLKMLPEIELHGEKNGTQITKVTSVRTICDAILPGQFRSLLGEVDKRMRLYLTILVTTATAERSFSALCGVKTYLRSTMMQERLNHVLLLHSQTQRTDDIDLSMVAREFIQANERRSMYFGNS